MRFLTLIIVANACALPALKRIPPPATECNDTNLLWCFYHELKQVSEGVQDLRAEVKTLRSGEVKIKQSVDNLRAEVNQGMKSLRDEMNILGNDIARHVMSFDTFKAQLSPIVWLATSIGAGVAVIALSVFEKICRLLGK